MSEWHFIGICIKFPADQFQCCKTFFSCIHNNWYAALPWLRLSPSSFRGSEELLRTQITEGKSCFESSASFLSSCRGSQVKTFSFMTFKWLWKLRANWFTQNATGKAAFVPTEWKIIKRHMYVFHVWMFRYLVALKTGRMVYHTFY